MTDVFPDAYVTDTGFNDIVTMMSTFDNASGTVASSDTISAMPRARFPLELWAMTIRNMRDRTSHAELAYLWTTVRRVSKFFEQEIENLFLEIHVGKTWIYADCGKRSKATLVLRRES